MNREIKFRGKRKDNGKWIFGGYMKNKNGTYISDTENYHLNASYKHYLVVPETVGQYTGLKDKNGKEIYEGDIVTKCNVPYTVMFDPQGYWCLDGNGALNSEMLSSELLHFEVIGNVYEREVEDEYR